MTIGFKVLSVGAGIGIVGGAGATTYYLLKDDSIGKALKDKGHTLLDFDISNTADKTVWEAIVTAYSNNEKKLDNLTIAKINSDGPVTPENIISLKKACSKVIESNNDETTLKIAEQYCVTPINIKNFLSKKGTILNTNNEKEANVSEWDEKVRNYSREGNNNLIADFKLVSPTKNNGKDNRDQLRAACEKLAIKHTYEPDFHSNLAKFEEWCFIANKK